MACYFANDSLNLLLAKAEEDRALRERIFKTREDKNPVSALCELATAEGYPVDAMELINYGEESCAAMLRSVNGGGVEAPDDWDDLYEMFFSAMELLK